MPSTTQISRSNKSPQKQTATSNREGMFDIKHSINAIRKSALSWNDKAQTELYGLLYQCLLLTQKVEALAERERVVIDVDIKEMLEEKKFKATKLPNQIVQLVFAFADMDRRLVSKYATVLNKFKEAEESEHNFISWLNENGGINGVTSNSNDTKKKGLSQSEKAAEVAKNITNYETITTIENEFGVNTDKAFVLYVVPNAEGKLEVKRVVTKAKLITPITASFYDKELAESSANADENVLNEVREEVREVS
jgi:hypothetical protein